MLFFHHLLHLFLLLSSLSVEFFLANRRRYIWYYIHISFSLFLYYRILTLNLHIHISWVNWYIWSRWWWRYYKSSFLKKFLSFSKVWKFNLAICDLSLDFSFLSFAVVEVFVMLINFEIEPFDILEVFTIIHNEVNITSSKGKK